MRRPSWMRRDTLRQDGAAGVVLGVESVPDGLASGLLAGVNPVFGLYAYLVGTIAGALATSSAFMAVQATGAMSIIVADVDAISGASDQPTALFTLSVLTGAAMLAAGLLRLGGLLRFVSNAVMVGFINAVGVNIVLGQLPNFTGYAADGGGRIARTLDTLLHPGRLDGPTVAVGVATIGLVMVLERTRLGPLGMVVAIAATSGAAIALGWGGVATLADIAEVPRTLPRPVLPDLGLIAGLAVPALSLAFVGLVQGSAISANFTNPDGSYPDASRDFVGQGVANVASGVFQGMPVGGSMSASSLARNAGARSRQALVIASAVMAMVILLLADVVGSIAMPALAGLLMLIGVRTIKPADITSVVKVGNIQAVVLTTTFVLTMVIPLQFAVLVGVGLSVVLYVLRQSNKVVIARWAIDEAGDILEAESPPVVGASEVIVLQPYGSLFFAAAPVFEAALPQVTEASRSSVVILRLRGRSDLGATFMDVLLRYARRLDIAGCKLVIVSANERIHEQLEVTGLMELLGEENVYLRDEHVLRALRRADADARVWISQRQEQEPGS